MNRNYVIAAILASSLVATAGVALAHGKKGGMRGMGPMMLQFEDVDSNGDGKLTQEEMDSHAKARFDAADTDGNGKLSSEEMTAAARKRQEERRALMIARMVERMDADDDGELSFDEMPGQKTRAGRLFARMDSDGDGAISKAEMEAAREKFGERRRSRMGGLYGSE